MLHPDASLEKVLAPEVRMSCRMESGDAGGTCCRLGRSSFVKTALLASCLFALAACSQGDSVKVVEYDPDRAWNGHTYFTSRGAKKIVGTDMEGNIFFDFLATDELHYGMANGFEVEEDGTIVYIVAGRAVVMRRSDLTVLYRGPSVVAHHSITKTPQGTLMFLAADPFSVDHEPWYPVTCAQGDVILELDPETGEFVWEWRLRDYVDPVEHHDPTRWLVFPNDCFDWSHGNTVRFIPRYVYNQQEYEVVLYNSNMLNTFWMIDYATGDVLWSCGQHGTFGNAENEEDLLFAPAHEIEMTENDVFVMFDNGSHRAGAPHQSYALMIQVDPLAGEAQVIWSWADPGMYDWWGADADLLPNGNVLVTSCTHGKLIEVTPEGDVVWRAQYLSSFGFPQTIYQSQRVPYEWDPWLPCVDSDEDGYGDPASRTCPAPERDCDDGNPDVYPGAAELCDGLDNDCEGTVPPEESDADGDGYRICEGDCDDDGPETNPGAAEICDDGADNDCDDIVDGEDPDCVT